VRWPYRTTSPQERADVLGHGLKGRDVTFVDHRHGRRCGTAQGANHRLTHKERDPGVGADAEQGGVGVVGKLAVGPHVRDDRTGLAGDEQSVQRVSCTGWVIPTGT